MKYDRSIIYSPALVDRHCFISVKWARIIGLKKQARIIRKLTMIIFNIFRKVFEVLKQLLYCVERFWIVSSVLGNITYIRPSKWFSTTKLFNIIEMKIFYAAFYPSWLFRIWRLTVKSLHFTCKCHSSGSAYLHKKHLKCQCQLDGPLLKCCALEMEFIQNNDVFEYFVWKRILLTKEITNFTVSTDPTFCLHGWTTYRVE